jgi:hypothetical protein
MKKLWRKCALMAVFYYLLLLANACCHCAPERTRFYTSEGIVAQPIQFEILGDTAFSYTAVLKDSVARLNYGLNIQFDTKETVYAQFAFKGLISSAYACKCGPDYYSPRDTLKSIRIFTLKDFDASHPAGSEISEYFKLLKQATPSAKISKITIAEAIAELASISYSPYRTLQLYLDKMPDAAMAPIQFEIVAEFGGNKILKDTTSFITLY